MTDHGPNPVPGGKADGVSTADIARRHDVEVAYVDDQLATGIAHEREHTADESVARDIAMDHLFEDVDYYVKLRQVEAGRDVTAAEPERPHMAWHNAELGYRLDAFVADAGTGPIWRVFLTDPQGREREFAAIPALKNERGEFDEYSVLAVVSRAKASLGGPLGSGVGAPASWTPIDVPKEKQLREERGPRFDDFWNAGAIRDEIIRLLSGAEGDAARSEESGEYSWGLSFAGSVDDAAASFAISRPDPDDDFGFFEEDVENYGQSLTDGVLEQWGLPGQLSFGTYAETGELALYYTWTDEDMAQFRAKGLPRMPTTPDDVPVADPAQEVNRLLEVYEQTTDPAERAELERRIDRWHGKSAAKADSPIDRLHPIKSLWYETEDGDRYYPTDEEMENPYDLQGDTMKDYPYQRFLNPVLLEDINGPDGQIMRGETTINCVEPIVMHLVGERGWRLVDAITVAASACARCLNILLEEVTGEPYAERDTAGTHCDICSMIDPEYHADWLAKHPEDEHDIEGEMLDMRHRVDAALRGLAADKKKKPKVKTRKKSPVKPKAPAPAAAEQEAVEDEQDVTVDDEMQNEPSDDDIIVRDQSRGRGYAAYQYGREVAVEREWATLLYRIQQYMDTQKFWPNVWEAEERGGYQIVDMSAKAPPPTLPPYGEEATGAANFLLGYVDDEDRRAIMDAYNSVPGDFQGLIVRLVDEAKKTADRYDLNVPEFVDDRWWEGVGIQMVRRFEEEDAAALKNRTPSPVAEEQLDLEQMRVLSPAERQRRVDQLLEQYEATPADQRPALEHRIRELSACLRRLAGARLWGPGKPPPFPRPGQRSGLWGTVELSRDSKADDLDELLFLVTSSEADLYRELFDLAGSEEQYERWVGSGFTRDVPQLVSFLRRHFNYLTRQYMRYYDEQIEPLDMRELLPMLREIYGEEQGSQVVQSILDQFDEDDIGDMMEDLNMDDWTRMMQVLDSAVSHAKGQPQPSKKTKMRAEDIPAMSPEDIQARKDKLMDRFNAGEIDEAEFRRQMDGLRAMGSGGQSGRQCRACLGPLLEHEPDWCTACADDALDANAESDLESA